MSRQQVRILTLSLDEDGTSTVFKLEKGWVLQFRLGPSLLGQTVALHTNYPLKDGSSFDRSSFATLQWESDSNNKADDTSIFANIQLNVSGSFHFYLTQPNGVKCGQGYFLVDPTLHVGQDDRVLPMDCIQCQTVLSKNMGPVSSWPEKLMVSKESGYNMIHFTPVHVIGASDSAYCLADQQNLDPRYEAGWDQVVKVIQMMKKEWGMLSICDIVLNHTAKESQWIREHPECSYNCINSPHLRPAFLLDRMIFQVTLDIADGKLENDGIPKGVLNEPHHFDVLQRIIHERYLPPLKLHEFFMANTDQILEEFESHEVADVSDCNNNKLEELKLMLDPERHRFGSTIDMKIAKTSCKDKNELREKLNALNSRAYDECQDHLSNAVNNVLSGAKYERLDDKGPKIKKCDPDHPLICQYFTCNEAKHDLKELEEKMYQVEHGQFFMVHNGWVMGMDPSVDFASAQCMVYFRRELVAWGDSVKLNFGSCFEDNPFLWQFMVDYVEQVARVFQGIRLDNCHSTPIHVAEFLIDAARKIQPDLYVIAELFTGSEATDNKYLNRLGINSLIREGLRAWNSHELGRLVYHYGGATVGAFSQPRVRPLHPCRVAHAIFYDQTHDNQSSMELRTPYDCLPSSALCLSACCAFGSNRGYDELVPHHIHVVNEKRQYSSWEGKHTGLMKAKQALNDLHFSLGESGFNEVFVDQMDADVVAVTRHNPNTHQTVVLVAHTAFNAGVNIDRAHTGLWLNVEGQLLEVELEANLHKARDQEFAKKANFINGLENFEVDLRTHLDIKDAKFVKMHSGPQDFKASIELNNFRPGSVIAFRFQLNEAQRNACHGLQELLRDPQDLNAIVNRLRLSDLNHVLFKCDQEERDDIGSGVYSLDGYGPLKYAGLQGVMSILADIRPIDDLGNWLPGNLRNGDWMLDYIINRLQKKSSTKALATWFETKAFKLLRSVPRYLIPRYFDSVISMIYVLCLEQIWAQMSEFVQNGSSFVKAMALGSVQHGAVVRSALLPPTMGISEQMVSLAAGLPHFSTGYMRNWGRDTFISLRGLFILTGRIDEAKNIILAYAACLRHGLIPNLLDGGFKARFNCRDAIWWWLNCIKSYVQEVPEGHLILKDIVSRIFPEDDSEPNALGQSTQPLEDVIHEALQKHFQGLRFRERNAGKMIDEHMLDEGFNNEIGVDLRTGFVFGGNIHNCGTWMDKMGSSCEAGNKGIPATPRDGSAVELVGLSYSCIKWLADLNSKGLYPHGSVIRVNEDGSTNKWALKEWARKIESNFEQNFFVVKGNPVDKRPDLINKEFIYKDTLNSGHPWADYQLRCNFPITMAVAPELFDPEHAWEALQIARKKLLGPLGMATLDPDDWMYRPYYDNSNQSGDRTVAHGYNYHQGPEWVWPVGFFLRAYLYFGKVLGKQREASSFCMSVMSSHFTHVQRSHWRGIPELTNKAGEKCPHSNPIQAWSMACLLEVLREIED